MEFLKKDEFFPTIASLVFLTIAIIILLKEFERNQSSEERHFSVWHRRQNGRPNIQEPKLLHELQVAQFTRYPNIWKDLGFHNKQADQMLSALSTSSKSQDLQPDSEPCQDSQPDSEPCQEFSSVEDVEDVENVIEKIWLEKWLDDDFDPEGNDFDPERNDYDLEEYNDGDEDDDDEDEQR